MKKRFLICLLGALLLMGLPATGHASPSLLAHWTLNESSGSTIAYDSGPSGYNGTLSITGASFVSGGIAGTNALSLNASQSGLVNMGLVLNNLSGTSYTIAAWVNTNVEDEANQTVVGSHQGTIVAGYILGVNSSASGVYGATSKAWFYNAFGGSTPTSSITVVDDDWHQIVGVRGGGTVSLYVDGIFQQSFPDQGLVDAPAGTPLLFGGLRAANGVDLVSLYTGLIDDVQFYSGALTAGEIAYLYDNPGAVVPLPGAVWLLGSGLLGLVGLKRFKES